MICQVIGWVGFFATHLYFTDFVAVVSMDFSRNNLEIFFTFAGSLQWYHGTWER